MRFPLAALALTLLVSAPASAQESRASAAQAVLTPGDSVRIEVWRKPEFSGDFVVAAAHLPSAQSEVSQMLSTLCLALALGQAPVGEKPPTWLSQLAGQSKSGDEYLAALSKSEEFKKVVEAKETKDFPPHVVKKLGEVSGQNFPVVVGKHRKPGPPTKEVEKGGSAKEVTDRLVKNDEIKKLADLESREVLLAKLAGALQASLSQAVYLFAAPLSQTARVVDALRAKVETEGPAVAAPEADAEVAAEETPADAAPAAEATSDVATGGDDA